MVIKLGFSLFLLTLLFIICFGLKRVSMETVIGIDLKPPWTRSRSKSPLLNIIQWFPDNNLSTERDIVIKFGI
jgi:hypothetical protein